MVLISLNKLEVIRKYRHIHVVVDVINIYYLLLSGDFLRRGSLPALTSCRRVLLRCYRILLALTQWKVLDRVHEHGVDDLDEVAWTKDVHVSLGCVLLVANQEQLWPFFGKLLLKLF